MKDVDERDVERSLRDAKLRLRHTEHFSVRRPREKLQQDGLVGLHGLEAVEAAEGAERG